MLSSLIERSCRRLDISKTELARRAGLSRETLYRLMRGELRTTTIDTVFRLAQAVQVAPIYLLRLVYHDVGAGPATMLSPRQAGDHASFVSDVTFPDNDIVFANQSFVKVWEIQNTGSLAWENRSYRCMDCQIVLAKREADGSLAALIDVNLVPEVMSVPCPDTPPGGIARIEASFRAPTLPCAAMSLWKMFDANGEPSFPGFSGIWCKVQVVAL